MRSSGPAPSASRITLLVGLLAATVVFASLLAYEAHDAARAERVTADRALHDYATVAAWELQSAARKRLDAALARALDPVTAGASAAAPYEPLPSVDLLRSSAASEFSCEAMHPDGARTWFRLDLRDGSFSAQPPGRPDAPAIAATALRFVRDVAKPEAPLGVLWHTLPDSTRFVALGVRYVRLGAPVAVYGFTGCASAFAGPFLRAVLREHPLLPAAAGAGVPNDSLFAVAIVGAGGTTTATTMGNASPYAADAVLDGWGGARAHVAIRRDATAQLLVRPPVRSRLPLLLGLLVMSAGLAIVAVVQIRREHELARLRADFTSSVSHELRTPLAQILLFGETLSLGRARDEREKRFAADTIVQEARRLMHIVDNVLTFSRGRRGPERVTARPVALRGAIEEIVAAFAPLAQAAGARLELSVQGAPVALADHGALRQIVLNLLDNAVKYGPSGQAVGIDVRRDAEVASIAVEDEGVGIAPSDRERVWSPYVRLRREPHPARGGGAASGGSGIGLAVVRELVESLGGRVRVEGAPGGGARFVVELRAAPTESAGVPAATNLQAPPAAVQYRAAARDSVLSRSTQHPAGT